MATIDDDDGGGGGEIKEGSSEEEGEMLSISSILPSAAQTYEPALEPLSEAVSCRSVCLPNSANRRHTAHTHKKWKKKKKKYGTRQFGTQAHQWYHSLFPLEPTD